MFHLKKLAFVLPVALSVTLGWSGSISPVFAETVAPAQAAQKQGTIEHMKVVRVDGVTIAVYDTWFNPKNGSQRNDYLYFYEDTRDIKKDTRFSNEESSLFQRTANNYKDKRWTSVEAVELNGKQVEVLKANNNAKGNPAYHMAYIDKSTGMPIKVEDYNSNNEVMAVYLYFFDYVHEIGDRFIEEK